MVTRALIAVNAAVFLGMAAATAGDEQGLSELRRSWAFRSYGEPIGLLSYQFVHGGLLHLLGNMLFLWVFGPSVEDRLGRGWFVAFYLACGVASAAGWHALDGGPVVLSGRDGVPRELIEALPAGALPLASLIGASGSIAGVTGAFMVLFPRTIVRVLLFFILIGVFEVPAVWFIAASFLKDFILHQGGPDGVAYSAHLAGTVFGFSVAFVLLRSRVLSREDFDLLYVFEQRRRRAEIRRASARAAGGAGGAGGAVPDAPADAKSEAVMALRGRLASAIAGRDWASAEGLASEFAAARGVSRVKLPRRAWIDLANGLFEAGRHEGASRAYGAFLEDYPQDPEGPHVRLMLALLWVRYLGMADRARGVLDQAARGLVEAEDLALLERLRDEIDGRGPSSSVAAGA